MPEETKNEQPETPEAEDSGEDREGAAPDLLDEEENKKAKRKERLDEKHKIWLKKEEAEIESRKALTKAMLAQAAFFEKATTDVLPFVSDFFKTKAPDVIERMKQEMQGELDFSIAKVLYSAGMVDKELVDEMARRTYTPPPTEPERQDAASSVLDNFDPSQQHKPIM